MLDHQLISVNLCILLRAICVLMLEIFHQLRAAVCPFIYVVFHTFQVQEEQVASSLLM